METLFEIIGEFGAILQAAGKALVQGAIIIILLALVMFVAGS